MVSWDLFLWTYCFMILSILVILEPIFLKIYFKKSFNFNDYKKSTQVI